jgi:hypothetical protein
MDFGHDPIQGCRNSPFTMARLLGDHARDLDRAPKVLELNFTKFQAKILLGLVAQRQLARGRFRVMIMSRMIVTAVVMTISFGVLVCSLTMSKAGQQGLPEIAGEIRASAETCDQGDRHKPVNANSDSTIHDLSRLTFLGRSKTCSGKQTSTLIPDA